MNWIYFEIVWSIKKENYIYSRDIWIIFTEIVVNAGSVNVENCKCTAQTHCWQQELQQWIQWKLTDVFRDSGRSSWLSDVWSKSALAGSHRQLNKTQVNWQHLYFSHILLQSGCHLCLTFFVKSKNIYIFLKNNFKEVERLNVTEYLSMKLLSKNKYGIWLFYFRWYENG